MFQIQSIDTPYFLTKQTANLQEDFYREIRSSASLFLLYGEVGVGKTRLLKELVSTRFNQLRVHWVDCNQAEDHFSATTELDTALEKTLNIANTGDVIIADHFELATNKIKHQLLQSWATDGIDKKFSLIIATSPKGIEEVRNLAARYSLDVKGFQLLPLTRKEVNGYCASLLFPLLLPNTLLMPSQTRRALNETCGLMGDLQDVVELHSHHITMQGIPSSSSIVKPLLVVSGLLIILLLAVLTNSFMPFFPVKFISINPLKETKFELTQPENLVLSKPEVKVKKSQTAMTPKLKQPIQVLKIEAPILVNSFAELTVIDSSNINLKKHPEIKIVEAEIVDVEKVEAVKVEARIIEINNLPKKESVKAESLLSQLQKEPHSDWFNAELKRSREWFETANRSRATIQLMSIDLDDTTDSTYFNYVKRLQKLGVDVSQLRVYRTRVPENILFSIVYGNYSSRRMASRSISNLPSSLGANQPISRSIGGILDEINQF